MDMSEMILNLVPRKRKHNGLRTSAVKEMRLQNYSLLFFRTMGLFGVAGRGGGEPKR
jgi:hypothetical protein